LERAVSHESKDNKDEDASQFRELMSDVHPLSSDQAEPFRKKRRAMPLPKSQEEDDEEPLAENAADAPQFFDVRKPGVQLRLYHDLQRGLMPPQASLDLHGMRVADARQAFSRFIKQALARQLRCIRVIHGKGRGSVSAQPVLKQRTYHWLLSKPEVLAFCTAPRWDGGTGATYVLLKRLR
jgi:DNA-nicking Smr family endonuclease